MPAFPSRIAPPAATLAAALAVILAVALAAAATPAFAWGQTGHRVIGELAEQRVDGRTRAEIARLLGAEDLAQAANWPDEQKSNPDPFWQRQASPWHYVTVPEGRDYAAADAPPEGDGYTALRRFTAILRDPAASREDKALALRFVVHIVGDLHQPLHVGNGTDRGGNDVKVTWFGEPTNLHSVWDSRLIDSRHLSYGEYARWLGRAITPEQTIAWWNHDPLVWIAESAAIRDTIYPPAGDGPAQLGSQLGYTYQYRTIDTAERRLQQGGVRLAAYLDWVFAGA